MQNMNILANGRRGGPHFGATNIHSLKHLPLRVLEAYLEISTVPSNGERSSSKVQQVKLLSAPPKHKDEPKALPRDTSQVPKRRSKAESQQQDSLRSPQRFNRNMI